MLLTKQLTNFIVGEWAIITFLAHGRKKIVLNPNLFTPRCSLIVKLELWEQVVSILSFLRVQLQIITMNLNLIFLFLCPKLKQVLTMSLSHREMFYNKKHKRKTKQKNQSRRKRSNLKVPRKDLFKR